MNSEPSYVVIAVSNGDGGGDISSGERIWSERFNTRIAAEQACAFFKSHKVGVRLIEDGVCFERAPTAA